MCALCSAKECNTSPNADRLLLMWQASFRVSPTAPLFPTHSEPARSTMVNLLRVCIPVTLFELKRLMTTKLWNVSWKVNVVYEWDLLLEMLSEVVASALFFFPNWINLMISPKLESLSWSSCEQVPLYFIFCHSSYFHSLWSRVNLVSLRSR